MAQRVGVTFMNTMPRGVAFSSASDTGSSLFQKTRNEKEIARLNTKVQKLESLCRALQMERNRTSGGAISQNEAKALVKEEEVKGERLLHSGLRI